MEYLKFICKDMAAQSAELDKASLAVKRLSNDLSGIYNLLDPKIKAYGSIYGKYKASREAMADIGARLSSAQTALEQAAEIYRAAENAAMRECEALPTGIDEALPIGIGGSGGSGGGADIRRDVSGAGNIPAASVSTIINSDLIVEDWLAELMYKQGK